MSVLLGIDIGTSSSKVMLLEAGKGILGVKALDYDVGMPKENYAEQDPDEWWNAVVWILKELHKDYPDAFSRIDGISLSGQMHGCVVVGKEGQPLRPGIIWLDQRSQKQLDEIYDKFGIEQVKKIIHNRIFTGFAFPSLLWIRENEPQVFEKIDKVLLPKDYIRYKMTGRFGTEASDASSTTGVDIKKRDWAWELIDLFKMPRYIFPKCHESTELAGCITNECARVTGLREGIPVAYGCGDQQAHVIGAGVIEEGIIVSNIGTGGEMSVYSKEDVYDPRMRIHTFCHAIDHAYTIYGAHLCSGMSMKWLKNNVLEMEGFSGMTKMAAEITPGCEGLIYLPYLAGSRTPEMDVSAKGMFFGMQLKHDKRHFIRSVMEGIIYDFRRSQDIFEEIGIRSHKVVACGGGAKSSEWLQIQADILNREVHVCKEKEQACLGACIIAGVSIGAFQSVKDACRQYVSMEERVYKPNQKNVAVYEKNYDLYKRLYKENKSLFV